MNAPSDEVRAGTVGRPVWGVEVRIAREDGTDARAGETGEVRVRGQNVMIEYVDDHAITVEAMRDGWLSTGDVGQLSADGVLTIVDRRKDLILRGGNNVYPSIVEDALASHASVDEVAVVGRPDSYYGEEIVAVIVPNKGASPTAAELAAHAKSRLSEISVPREWAFVPRLPLGSSGKVLKRELRRLLAEGVLSTERA